MPIRDIALSVVAAYMIGLFLLPTLINTNSFQSIPFPYVVLYVISPIIVLTGMFVVHQIAKRIAILWQVSKFALVGVLNTAIDFGILNLLILLTNFTAGAGIGVINIPSFTAAIINSYFWNRKWVFEKSHSGSFIVFAAVTIIGLIINTAIEVGVTTFIPPLFGLTPVVWANVAKVFATGFSMIWNFTGYKLIVFKK